MISKSKLDAKMFADGSDVRLTANERLCFLLDRRIHRILRRLRLTRLARRQPDGQRDPYIERFETTVTVTNGTAYLYGTVDSNFERIRADDLASRVSGVMDVKNYLTVDYDTPYFLFICVVGIFL